MSLTASLLIASLAATPLSGAADAPLVGDGSPTRARGFVLVQSSPTTLLPGEQGILRYTLEDAPTSRLLSFSSSLATSFTGLVVLMGFLASPPGETADDGASWRARLGTGLFLMSVGPSIGDLMNQNTASFLVGAIGRSALAAVSWGAIELVAGSSTNSVNDAGLVVGTILLVSIGSLVWLGWGGVDLIRSVWAPERWVERQNATRSSRAPVAEVRRTGGLRYAF